MPKDACGPRDKRNETYVSMHRASRVSNGIRIRPRWNAATDRIARRLSDSVTIAEVRPAAAPAPAESPATPVLSEEKLFDAIFIEEEQPIGARVERLPIDTSEAARMDLNNT